EAAPAVAADHQHFERIVPQKDHARGRDRLDLYFCHPTHSSPSGPRSFFQIGTVCLKRSMMARHAVNASPRWGEAQAMTIDASPTFSRPSRCTTSEATPGNCIDISFNIFVISFSAIGRYAS